jgi:ActR/RegA family two-component response regulator
MPGKLNILIVDDNEEFCRNVKDIMELKDIITGYMHELGDLAKQAVEMSAYTCLEKPIDMNVLLKLLGRIQQNRPGASLKEPKPGQAGTRLSIDDC